MSIADPISKIGDVIRGSLIAERLEQINPLLQSIIQHVKRQGGKLYVKNFWADPKPLSLGYVGVHIKICMPIPSENPDQRKKILMELQLHLKAIMDGTEDCAKEISHRLYKVPQDGAEETISPEIISSSQLIYLTAMTRLLTPQKDLEIVDNAVQLLQTMTKSNAKIRLAMTTAMLLQNKNLSLGDWNERFQVIVPKDGDAVAQAWMDTAKKINAILSLPSIEMDASDSWTNTATSIEEIYEDANQIAPFFSAMCQQAAASLPGCTFNFGPNNAYMKKAKDSLLDKIKKDSDEALKPLFTQLMRKIGKTWTQITESDSVPFRNFSEVQSLNFSGCSQITDSDLAFLKYFSSLERLNLAQCSRLTDAGLAHLEGLARLGCLNLSGGGFTDKGLYYLWCLPALHSLNRLGCPEITDAGLVEAGLQRLIPSLQNPQLQSSQTASNSTRSAKDTYLKLLLQLLENASVKSDSSFAEILEQEANELMDQEEANLSPKQIKGYQILQSLLVGEKVSSIVAKNFRNLHASEEKKSPPVALQTPTFNLPAAAPAVFNRKTSLIDDDTDEEAPQKTTSPEEGKRNRLGISQETNLSSIQSLNLRCSEIRESDWALLESLPKLHDLSLEECTDDDLAFVGRLSALKSLNLLHCKEITDQGLAHLGRLSTLQSLNLYYCEKITDKGLAHVGRLSALKNLNLTYCFKITDKGLAHVGKLPALKNLNLFGCCEITDKGMAHVGQLSALQSLNLGWLFIDKGLSHLERLLMLQSLDLTMCKNITDKGLAHVGRLSALQSLDLRNCGKITDQGLPHIGQLSALKSLNLGCCGNITDSGLLHVKRLSALQTLHLCNCREITDSGLAHLGRLPALQCLVIEESTKISRAAKEKLRKQGVHLISYAEFDKQAKNVQSRDNYLFASWD